MTTGETGEITLDLEGQELEQVTEFVCLVSTVTGSSESINASKISTVETYILHSQPFLIYGPLYELLSRHILKLSGTQGPTG